VVVNQIINEYFPSFVRQCGIILSNVVFMIDVLVLSLLNLDLGSVLF